MSSWSNLLHHAETGHHVVHLYGRNDASLVRGIAEYTAEGLLRREPVLIVATQVHVEAVRRQLDEEDVDVAGAIKQGALRFVDADLLLPEFVGDGGPRWEVFCEVVGGLLEEMQGKQPGSGLRVFGEMVGILWISGRRAEAKQLEAYWNRLQETHHLSLFCGYPVDPFEDMLEPSALEDLIGLHSHTCAGAGTLFTMLRDRPRDVRAALL